MPNRTRFFCIKVKKETPKTAKSLSALLKLVIHYEHCNKKGSTLYGFDANLSKDYISEMNSTPNKKVLFFISKNEGSQNCSGFVFVGTLIDIIDKEKAERKVIPDWFINNNHRNYLLIENLKWINNEKNYNTAIFKSQNGIKIENIKGGFSLVEKQN